MIGHPIKRKSETPWDGPYQIEPVVGEHPYKLIDLHGKRREDTDHGTWLKRAYSQYDSPILHTAESTFLFAARMLSYPLKFYKTWLKSMDESNEEITTTNPAYDDLAYKKKRQI